MSEVYPEEYTDSFPSEYTAPVCSGGVNETGFAIANTTVYDSITPANELYNANTVLMETALAQCATVDEFETLLRSWNTGSLCGIFPVIDAQGGAVLFEARADNNSTPEVVAFEAELNGGFVNRTNSMQSVGGGVLQIWTDTPRELRAYELLTLLKNNNELNHRTMMQIVAKDVCGGDPLDYCGGTDWCDTCETDLADPEDYLTTYCISRYQTEFAFVVDGVAPEPDGSGGYNPEPALLPLCTMWCTLGEPALSVSTPYFPYAREISRYAFHDSMLYGTSFNLIDGGDYWDGNSPTENNYSTCFFNQAYDYLSTDILYDNNGYSAYYIMNGGMDASINYTKLLYEVQVWSIPIENVIYDKTETFLNTLTQNPDLVTRSYMSDFSDYCAEYAYNNYTNRDANFFPWNFAGEESEEDTGTIVTETKEGLGCGTGAEASVKNMNSNSLPDLLSNLISILIPILMVIMSEKFRLYFKNKRR